MKKALLFGLIALLITIGCNQPTDSNGSGGLSIGYAEELTVGSETLRMICANNISSISFPTVTNDSVTLTLTTKFFLGETEVTNAVMAEVYQWAYDNSWFSTTEGDHNGLSATTVKYGGQELLNLDDANCRVDYSAGTFTAEIAYENNPVTNVTWYGAVIFCNWLTEMRDGNTNNLVYTTIGTNWVDDDTTETVTKTGYRLPSEEEWEYAARYRGNDTTNTVDGFSSPYFTTGYSASGATAIYTDAAATQLVAVYDYTDPNPYDDEQPVKSLGIGSANSLGLYDMSGNVWEWCFNATSAYRAKRGGSWGWDEGYILLAFGSNEYPYHDFDYLGFRLCRTAD